jgi:hypothetical protein
MNTFFARVCLVASLVLAAAGIGHAQANTSYELGERDATQFAYGYGGVAGAHIAIGFTGTGTQTALVCPAIRTTADGRSVALFSYPLGPISFDTGTTVAETVTPTSVSIVGAPSGVEAQQPCAQVTGSFTNAHAASENLYQVRSGSFGLQEAINDAAQLGANAGAVVIGPNWGGTNAILTAATVLPGVAIIDKRTAPPRYWNPTATGAFLAPPTLPAINIAGQAACDTTHQMCSDATVAGSASWGGTVFACWAYVDIEGNEGPCSATTSWTSVASKAIDMGIPAASPGAVGAVPYLSLSGGTYILAYQIPVTATVCTMTKLETITPACAVTNTTYNQIGSTFGAGGLFTTGGAQITTFPVNTAQLYTDLATTAQTLAGQHALTNSSVSYSYAPGSRLGACGGVSSSNIVGLASASAISGSSATTVPQPVASWTIPANCFNYIGAEFRVSGKFVYTDGGSGTSTIVAVGWDANGTNVASVAKPLCNINDTFTSVGGADTVNYTCTVRILTTGATGTAEVNGMSAGAISAGATTLQRVSVDNGIAATGTLNLTTNARITVFFEAVGATSNPGAQGLESTLEVLN